MKAFYRLPSIAAVVPVAGLIALSGAGAATASECPPGSTPMLVWGPQGQNTVCDTHGVDPGTLIPPADPNRAPAPPYVAPAPVQVAPAPAPVYIAPAPAPVHVAPVPAPPLQAPAPINNGGSVIIEQQPSATVPDTDAVVADEAAKAETETETETETEAMEKAAQQDAEATAKASSSPTASASAPSITKQASVDKNSATSEPDLIYVIGGILAGVLLLGSAAGIWLRRTGRTVFSTKPWKRS